MVKINFCRRCIFPVLLFFVILPHFIFAQQFTQRLSWTGGEHALRYEVIIEREENRRYVSHRTVSTTNSFIEISLPTGRYRYRVIPYDLLDRPIEDTQWRHFEVRPALVPQPERVDYGHIQYYLLTVQGGNLNPDARIFLRDSNRLLITPDFVKSHDPNAPQPGAAGTVPRIQLLFALDRLSPGEYDVIIRNPSGLEAVMTGITVKFPEPEPENIICLICLALHLEEEIPSREFIPIPPFVQLFVDMVMLQEMYHPQIDINGAFLRAGFIPGRPADDQEMDLEDSRIKPVVWNIGAAYTPLYPLFLGNYNIDRGLNNKLHPCLTINAGMVFAARSAHIGLELTASWFSLSYEDYFFYYEYIFGGRLLIRKYTSRQNSAFNFRAGMDYLLHAGELTLNFGTSLYIHLFNSFFMETGVNYVHFFHNDNSRTGFFQPVIGFGLRF